MQFPIIIGLRRSRILDAMLCLVVLLASILSLAYPGSLAVHLSLLAACLLLAGLAWRGLVPAVQVIRLERNGEITICLNGSDEFMPAHLEPSATVHAWLTVMRLRLADGRWVTVIATLDTQDPDDFRRLRMFMRWQADFSATGDAA